MTAYRVIDDHQELFNSGDITHPQLDAIVSGTQWLVLSSSGQLPPQARIFEVGAGLSVDDHGPQGRFRVGLTSGTQDNSARYLVTSLTSTLPNARLLVTGPGITLVDDVANKTFTVSVDGDFVRSLFSFQEVPSGSADGANLTYGLIKDPHPSSSLMFFINGVLQAQGPSSDYLVSGSVITMLWPPRSGSNIFASYPRLP